MQLEHVPPATPAAVHAASDTPIAFLRELREGPHNLVAIVPDGTGPSKIVGITRDSADHPDLAAFIAAYEGHRNIYYSVNEPRAEAPDKKLEKEDIARIHYTWVDIDPKKDEPLDIARSRLLAAAAAELGQIHDKATFAVDSGGGVQIFWRLTKALEVTPENTQAAEDQGRGLAKHFGGDAIQNIERIMRLPGTVNLPDAKKRKRGRVAAPAKLIGTNPTARYDLAAIARIAPPVARTSKGEDPANAPPVDWGVVAAASSYVDLAADLRMRFEDSRKRDPDIDLLWRGDLPLWANDDSRSGFDHHLIGRLRHAGFTLTEIAQLLWVYDYGKLPEEAERGDAQRYLSCSWSKAPHSAREAFEGVPISEPAGPRLFTPTPFEPFDAAAMAPRRWLLGSSMLRGSPGGISAPGGSNKTTLLLQRMIAICTGREITGEKVWERGRVWYINLEENADEIRRRIAAVCLEFKIPQSELRGKFLIGAGADTITLAKLKDNMAVATMDTDRMIATAKHFGTIAIGIDPLVQFHKVNENANEQMAVVVGQCVRVAEHSDTAVLFAAHSRKGAQAGDADSTRGASAIRDGVRLVETLAVMTDEEATKLGVPEAGRRYFVRLDNAKGNLVAPCNEVQWFQRVGVSLGNGDGTRQADVVGVLRPYDMTVQAEAAAAERARVEDPGRQSLAQALADAMPADRCPLSSMIGVAMDLTGRKERAAQTRIVAAVPAEPAYRLVNHNGVRLRLSLAKKDPNHPKSALDLCRAAHTEDRGAK